MVDTADTAEDADDLHPADLPDDTEPDRFVGLDAAQRYLAHPAPSAIANYLRTADKRRI